MNRLNKFVDGSGGADIIAASASGFVVAKDVELVSSKRLIVEQRLLPVRYRVLVPRLMAVEYLETVHHVSHHRRLATSRGAPDLNYHRPQNSASSLEMDSPIVIRRSIVVEHRANTPCLPAG